VERYRTACHTGRNAVECCCFQARQLIPIIFPSRRKIWGAI